jgi:hypothetical protein
MFMKQNCSLAADAIRKTIKKVMNCRKTTINLKRHGFCGQVQQMGDVLLNSFPNGKVIMQCSEPLTLFTKLKK